VAITSRTEPGRPNSFSDQYCSKRSPTSSTGKPASPASSITCCKAVRRVK